MLVFVGDDWSEDHHDVHLMNEQGESLAARRLPEGLEGMTALHELLAEHAQEPAEVVIGIETERGPWVAALLGAGYRVYAINPRAASRYRERHQVGGGKSDSGDARMLANLVRTDRHNHREVAGDSAAASAVQVRARAQQQLVWNRTRESNRLRNALLQYFPAALRAFADLTHADALSVLAIAPEPRAAARLSMTQLRSALRRGGRTRNVERRAAEIRAALRVRTLEVAPAVSEAFADSTRAEVAQLQEINRQLAALESKLAAAFEEHPDAAVYLSMPGLGTVLGARVLGEFGDDPDRFVSAKSRRNYAGTSPLTRASGRRRAVTARFVRNRRLYDPVHMWAFCSLRASPGCRAYYRRRRAIGDGHHQALRALGNRLVGYLHGGLSPTPVLRRGDRLGESQRRRHRTRRLTSARDESDDGSPLARYEHGVSTGIALCGCDVISQNPLSQLQRSTQPQPLARSPSVDQG